MATINSRGKIGLMTLDTPVDPPVDVLQPTHPASEPTVFMQVKWRSGEPREPATAFPSVVLGLLGKKMVMTGVIPLPKLPMNVSLSGPAIE